MLTINEKAFNQHRDRHRPPLSVVVMAPNLQETSVAIGALEAIQHTCAHLQACEVIVVTSDALPETVFGGTSIMSLAIPLIAGEPWEIAWQHGIEQARGSNILLLSGNVEPQPGWYEAAVREFERDQTCTGVSLTILDEHGNPVTSQPPTSAHGVCLFLRADSLDGTEPRVKVASLSFANLTQPDTSDAPETSETPQHNTTPAAPDAPQRWIPQRWIPPTAPTTSQIELLAQATGVFGPFHCPICGHDDVFATGVTENLRESGNCQYCHGWNRLRQLAVVINHGAQELTNTDVHALTDVVTLPLSVFHMQSSGTLHDALRTSPHYVCSEYLDGDFQSGAIVNGIMHQDVQALSFPDNSFDLIISSDVFEHVASPYLGHAEIYRVLKPHGRHIFTVPFYFGNMLDETMARITPEGTLEHLTDTPEYHEDPVRGEGALVFTRFGMEMLVELARLGFTVNAYLPNDRTQGVIGLGLVFEAIKPQGGSQSQ